MFLCNYLHTYYRSFWFMANKHRPITLRTVWLFVMISSGHFLSLWKIFVKVNMNFGCVNSGRHTAFYVAGVLLLPSASLRVTWLSFDGTCTVAVALYLYLCNQGWKWILSVWHWQRANKHLLLKISSPSVKLKIVLLSLSHPTHPTPPTLTLTISPAPFTSWMWSVVWHAWRCALWCVVALTCVVKWKHTSLCWLSFH